MALIVETGAVVADADSYISLADARTLAAKYGWTLPTDDDEAEIALRNGAEYVGLFEPEMKGSRVSADQTMSYPRKYVSIFGFDQSETLIPMRLMMAQVVAASEIGAGLDARASSDGRVVASEQVTGAVAVAYFDNGSTGAITKITKCYDQLKPLLTGTNNGVTFNVTRG